MTYQKLNRLRRSLTLPVVQSTKGLQVRFNLVRPYLKGLTKSSMLAAPEGEVKLYRAAKITRKETCMTVPVADCIRRGSEC